MSYQRGSERYIYNGGIFVMEAGPEYVIEKKSEEQEDEEEEEEQEPEIPSEIQRLFEEWKEQKLKKEKKGATTTPTPIPTAIPTVTTATETTAMKETESVTKQVTESCFLLVAKQRSQMEFLLNFLRKKNILYSSSKQAFCTCDKLLSFRYQKPVALSIEEAKNQLATLKERDLHPHMLTLATLLLKKAENEREKEKKGLENHNLRVLSIIFNACSARPKKNFGLRKDPFTMIIRGVLPVIPEVTIQEWPSLPGDFSFTRGGHSPSITYGTIKELKKKAFQILQEKTKEVTGLQIKFGPLLHNILASSVVYLKGDEETAKDLFCKISTLAMDLVDKELNKSTKTRKLESKTNPNKKRNRAF